MPSSAWCPPERPRIREPESVCVNVCPNQVSTHALLYLSRKCHWQNVPCRLRRLQAGCTASMCLRVTDMPIASIIHELHRGSFFCFQEAPRVERSLVLSVCFSVSCLKWADRERGRPFQITKWLSVQGRWGNVHLTASCYGSRFGVLCKIYASKHWWLCCLCQLLLPGLIFHQNILTWKVGRLNPDGFLSVPLSTCVENI